jgi:gamma-glutamyltranspeptidase / glutathione hydrolase
MADTHYAISRRPVYAREGMVATAQPLAAQAGLFILREGGNAVDAAIATAAALTVVEPTSNGIGCDAFALVWENDRLHGLNGSGRAPQLCESGRPGVTAASRLPAYGWPAVTVPGGPRAWVDLHERFGRLPLQTVLAPAIEYARQGYPLSPVVATSWARAYDIYAKLNGPEFRPWHETFMPEGFAPRVGALWRSEAQARTLEAIARSRAAEFYEGSIAMTIDRWSRDTGGWLRLEDLAGHRGEWVSPISVEYRGYEIWEMPPNTHAIAVLESLSVLSGFDMPARREDGEGLHWQIEAMKLGFADAFAYVGDPAYTKVPVEGILDPGYARERRRLIGWEAQEAAEGLPAAGDTVYLCTADRAGMMVSFIQSNYMGFGSGLVVPQTGIALHNRGCGFSLEAGHPNELKPGKRPYHTIIPGFLTREGTAVGPFGVMGAFMQPQGHLQVVVNTVDYGMDPQRALDAPRWQWESGRRVRVEASMPMQAVRELRARGHEVIVGPDDSGYAFGRGQIIWRDGEGVLAGGSESRADGQAIGF